MSKLAEKRGKPLKVNVESGKNKRIRKIAEGQTIADYYKIGEEETDGLWPAVRTGADAREYSIRIVSKHSFKKGGDNCDTKYSELDWRVVCENLFNSPNARGVLEFADLLEDDANYYIVMDKYCTANWVNCLLYERELEEADVKRIIRQLLTGLDAMHSQGFVHRDISPKTIRFKAGSTEKQELVLLPSESNAIHEPTSPAHKVDFSGRGLAGVAADAPQNAAMDAEFHAPERFIGGWSASSDMWSVGVLLYILICGRSPYSASEEIYSGGGGGDDIYEKMKNTTIDFDSDPWPEVPEARDLCQKFLAFRPEERIASSTEALRHPWLQ